jgi:hypothetical protein
MKTQKDFWISYAVVAVLGLIVMESVMGIITPTVTDLSTQQLLLALGSAAIGGLAGSLAPSHVRQ